MKMFISPAVPVVAAVMLSGALVTFAGCAQEGTDTAETASSPDGDTHAHDHPTHGPHEGSLIELGNHEYHAELVHDEDSGVVTVYVLDAEARTAVPIESQEVQINLTHDGQAEQFTLSAEPQETDPSGQSSRFTSSDAEIGEELDHGEAQLVVTVAGKQYRGAITHDHHGEGH